MRGVVVGVLLAWALSGHLAAEEKAAPSHLTVRSLSVVDAQGRTRGYLGIPERPGAGIELTLTDEKDMTRVSLAQEGGSTSIRLIDGTGRPSLVLTANWDGESSLGLVKLSTVEDSVVKTLALGPTGVVRLDDSKTVHRWPEK